MQLSSTSDEFAIAQASWDHFHRIDVMSFVTANNINLGGGLARDSRWAGNELESSELACF